MNPTTGGLYRVIITGKEYNQPKSWSVVLKIARENKEELDPPYYNYWKREFLAYQSGLLNDLSGGLEAPRFYGSTERPNGDRWIWLEDINESTCKKWPLSRYGLAAYHFGTFQGTYLTGKPIPPYPWFSNRWLRCMLLDENMQKFMDPNELGNLWEQSIVIDSFSQELTTQVKSLWTESTHYLDTLDQLPQTLCHLDAHRGNLMARVTPEGKEQTVSIDWAFIGPGVVGQDLGDLIGGSLFFFDVELIESKKLEEIALTGYINGLEQVGWKGDPQLIWLGYIAYLTMRTGVLLPG